MTRNPNLLNQHVIRERAAQLFGVDNLDQVMQLGGTSNGPIRVRVRRNAPRDTIWFDKRLRVDDAQAQINGFPVAEVSEYEPRDGVSFSDDEERLTQAVALHGRDDESQPVLVEYTVKKRGNAAAESVEYMFQSGGATFNYREGDPKGNPVTEEEQRRIAGIVGIPV